MKNDFENTIKSLSSRAKRALTGLSVKDLESFLKITREDLIKIRGCSKKTIKEIEALQIKLRDSRVNSQITDVLAEIDNIPSDVFESLIGTLSKRARNILKSLGIKDLKAFMLVNSDQLLECRQCGQKINNEILAIQSDIKTYIRDQINQQGFFQPEDLIKIPCLSGIRISDQKGDAGDIQDIFADVHNPALWLSTWIDELSTSNKQAKAFKLRKGMTELPPITLKASGEQIGVSKERVRQMVIQIEKAATRQQHRLKPLMEKAGEIVEANSGMVSLEYFTRLLLCKGKDEQKLKHATGLINFFAGLKIWKDHGLELQNDVVLSNTRSQLLIHHLTSMVEDIASNCADEKIDDKLWSVDYDLLNETLSKKMATTSGVKKTDTLSDALFNAVLDKLPNKL